MNVRNFRRLRLFVLLALLVPAMAICAENSNLKTPTLASPDQKGIGYISLLDQNTLERQFKDLMANKGFAYRKDKDIRSGQSRRLYFEKDLLVVDIVLRAAKNKGTEVIMTKYINSEITLDAKDTITVLKKPTVELPKYKLQEESKKASYGSVQDNDQEISNIEIEIPPPPKSERLKEPVPDPLLGIGGSGAVYENDLNLKEVESFYRMTLKRLGFSEQKDMGIRIMNFQRLRFESKHMAVELYLSPRGENGSRFIVVKYLDKAGVSKVEANPLYMAKLPKQDNVEGSDLAEVPRPANSVRQSGGTEKNRNSVSYLTPMKVFAVRDFYKQEMYSLGWKLSREVNMRQNDAQYAKEHNGVGFVRSVPLGTKIDLGEIVRDSYYMEFKSSDAMVQITIYPNFIDTAAGSMVDIFYVVNQNRGSR